MDSILQYAGSLEYKPRLVLTEEKKKQLQRLLVHSGLVNEPENPDVVIDWYKVDKDAQNNLLRQVYTLVYRDGGDGEAPAVLFYRLVKDRTAGTTTEFYHVPASSVQPALAEAWRWWEDASGAKLKRLTDYFHSIPSGGWATIN